MRPIRQDARDSAPILRGDIEAARAAVDMAVFLAGLADGRRVEQRQQRGRVVNHHPIEQRLVAILEAEQVDVLLEVVPLWRRFSRTRSTCSS